MNRKLIITILILFLTSFGCRIKVHSNASYEDNQRKKQQVYQNNLKLLDFDLEGFIDDIVFDNKKLEQMKSINLSEECKANVMDNLDYNKEIIREANDILTLINDLNKTDDQKTAESILTGRLNKSLPSFFILLKRKKPDICNFTDMEIEKDLKVTFLETKTGRLESEDTKVKLDGKSIKSFYEKISYDFNNKMYKDVIKTYEYNLDEFEEVNIPHKIRYYYGISLYEAGDDEEALEILKELLKDKSVDRILNTYLDLGKWFILNNKIDEAVMTYKEVVYNVLDLDEVKEKSRIELESVEKIKTPLESNIYNLIQNAERNLLKENLYDARNECLNAIKIMTTNSLYNIEFYDRCDKLFNRISEKEKFFVDEIIADSLMLADNERKFNEAKEPLEKYLLDYPGTDHKEIILTAITEIDKLSTVFSSEICILKIENFQNKYNDECLPKIVNMDYSNTLLCLNSLVNMSDPDCFAPVAKISDIKKLAQDKIDELQPVYLQSQIDKAANLFTRARQSSTKNKKKENLVKSYFILKKLKAEFNEKRFLEKISRYVNIVEKEIRLSFPELLERDEEAAITE